MDEPMDEAASEAEAAQWNQQQNPLLRPGSMVLMTISMEDYETQYWPKLEQAISQLLTQTPGHCIPISYEQMYSCVYKCVCKQFSERLYQDVIEHMSRHLATLSQELQALTDTPFRFLDRFASIMNQYLTALGGIVPIFNYMNRFYVETKLKTDLNEELRKLFQTTVVDTYISLVLTALEEAHSTPFSVPPATMSSLVKNLYSLSPDYANIKPHVFSVYIPNINPPTSAGQLEEYMRETQLIQQQIKSRPDFQSLDNSNSRKRTQDDLSV